ncbi:la-related protein 6 [Ciona intestinalis]
MQSACPQQLVWDPAVVAPHHFVAHPSHAGGLVHIAQHTGEASIGATMMQDMNDKALASGYMQMNPAMGRGLTPVFVKANDGSNWLLQHHYPGPQMPMAPHPYPGVQYVTFQPPMSTMGHLNPLQPQHIQVKPGDILDPHSVGRTVTMSEVNRLLPPIEPRNILVPKRRSGQGNSVGFSRVSNATNCERSLRGSNVGTRRRSQSFESNESSLAGNGFQIPLKKSSHSAMPVIEATVERMEGVGYRIPDPIQQRSVTDILEYYFSDDCLSRNGYLLKQISQNEEGYVSIKRIAALKRMKSLTRDIRTVVYCARLSEKLELSEDSMMIRRKQPLPSSLEPPRLIRTVIAINLPLPIPTIESVTSLFSIYGDLAQVRVLKPGKTLPPYLRDYTAWVPDLGKEYCALIEFETQEEAQGACREINMKNRDFNSLRVALLKPGARLRRTLYRKYKGEGDNETGQLETETNPLPKVCESMQNLPMFSSKCYKPDTVEPSIQSLQSRDYDASISGSGSDSDCPPAGQQMLANRPKYSVSDSGYSHSSGDERIRHIDSIKSSYNRNTKRSTRSLTTDCPESDSSDASSDVRRQRRGSPSFSRIPAGIIRYPVGPRDNCTKGFTHGFRKSLA